MTKSFTHNILISEIQIKGILSKYILKRLKIKLCFIFFKPKIFTIKIMNMFILNSKNPNCL